DRPLHVDVVKRTLPGLAVVSGTLSGVCHAPRPKGAAGQGEGDLLLAVNVSGCSLARQRDTELSLRDGDALFWTRSLPASVSCGSHPPASLAAAWRVRRSKHSLAGSTRRRCASFLATRKRCGCSSSTPKALPSPCRLRRRSCNGSRSATSMISWRRSSPPHAAAGRLPRGAA